MLPLKMFGFITFIDCMSFLVEGVSCFAADVKIKTSVLPVLFPTSNSIKRQLLHPNFWSIKIIWSPKGNHDDCLWLWIILRLSAVGHNINSDLLRSFAVLNCHSYIKIQALSFLLDHLSTCCSKAESVFWPLVCTSIENPQVVTLSHDIQIW